MTAEPLAPAPEPSLTVYVGYDPRFDAAWQVCVASLLRHASIPLQVVGLDARGLRARGLFWRPMLTLGSQRHDGLDGRPFSTEFAFTRFLVPCLNDYRGWALFCDSDFLFRSDVATLFEERDPGVAVQVVMREHAPAETVKMDGQAQQAYPRKNWSSLMLWNCGHEANGRLGPMEVNGWSGRDLHGFGWLSDHDIGQVDARWNWLEGTDDPAVDPLAVHFTRGTPDLPGWGGVAFASEWWNAATVGAAVGA